MVLAFTKLTIVRLWGNTWRPALLSKGKSRMPVLLRERANVVHKTGATCTEASIQNLKPLVRQNEKAVPRCLPLSRDWTISYGDMNSRASRETGRFAAEPSLHLYRCINMVNIRLSILSYPNPGKAGLQRASVRNGYHTVLVPLGMTRSRSERMRSDGPISIEHKHRWRVA